MKINKKGFTLIEILVVVLIIGILAAIALPQYRKVVEESKVSEALVNIKAIEHSMRMYLINNGSLPSGNVWFKDFAEIDLSGGEWVSDSSYETKNFDYNWLVCNSGGCQMEVYRKGQSIDEYALYVNIKPDEIAHNCITELTDKGRYMCKYLESQGWEYSDSQL